MINYVQRWWPPTRIGCRGSRGFTLVELMIVSSMIAILTAMSVILISRAKVQARETAAQGTLSMMTTAYEQFKFRHHEYPQWGPTERFSNSRQLIDALLAESFLPSVFVNYEYIADYDMFDGFAQDYYLKILPYDADDPDAPASGSYFIILVPHNYQRSYLAAIYDPTEGRVTVRTRKGDGRMDDYRLYTFKD